MAEELSRGLGFTAVYALIITSMIGSSLFFGLSMGAQIAGSASIISWLLLGLVTIYVAACFGELISMFPTSGGVYEFTKQSYGRFPSFLVGWFSWIVSNVGSAVLVVAALEFILPGAGTVQIAGIFVSKALVKAASAIAIILAFNYVAYRGIEASGTILISFAALVIILLAGIVFTGIGGVDINNFDFTALPVLMIFVSVFFLVESFFGWESASFLAEETKDPTKTIPKALVWSSATLVLLGVLIAFIIFGTYDSATVALSENPVLTLIEDTLPVAKGVFIFGVFLAFISGVVSNIIASPRLLFALARDKLFIEQATKLHPVYKSPVNAIIFQTIITILIMVFAFGQYFFLVSILVPVALVMYSFVVLAVPILRKTKPHHPRPFKVWGGSWLPALVALFYTSVVIGWFATETNVASIALLILGIVILALPVYWFVTMVYNPDAIISVSNGAARITYWLEDFLLPKKVRAEIIDIFRLHLRGKKVLEFGAGVGTFTEELAEAVGPKGSVIAVDLSKSNLEILEKRFKVRGTDIVKIIHDEHQINRVHPEITHAEMVYSIGFLGYVQDLRKVLRELNAVLPAGGHICFVEYTNFFKVLPDPAVVSDIARLEVAFADAGFSVRAYKRQGLLWNYLIIEGIKSNTRAPYM